MGFEAYRPWVYRRMLDIFANGASGYSSARWAVVQLLCVSAAGLLVRRLAGWAEMVYQSRTKRDLWLTSFKQLHRQSYSYLADQFSGSLTKRANKYDSAYEMLVDQLATGIGQSVVRIFVTIGAISFFRVDIALIFLVWTVVYILFVQYALKRKRPIDLEKSEVDSKVSGWLSDTVSNFSTIKTFASHARETKVFSEKVNHFRELLLRQWRAGFRLDTGQAILLIVLEVVVFSYALYLWSLGKHFTAGDMALLQVYIGQLNGGMAGLGWQLKAVTQGIADANEMTELILQPDTVADAPGATHLQVQEGSIVFSNASFTYSGKGKVIERLNLHILPGQKVALVGPSGGGKTTITKLLLRFYDVTKGSITVDGHDIRTITQDSLREAISFVPQEPILFHRSLLENIRYGKPDASEAEVVHAAKLAHAHEFISKSQQGYETQVGERGIKLSGGERQRVAIARAILKNAPILVLDEATSSLDSESEMLIQDALKHLMKGKTVIVIAHRLSTIMQMDRIVVLEKGKITEDGKHEELVKAKQGTYQKLWGIQAGSFGS